MGLKEVRDSDEFKEIFNHIQDILNERNESNNQIITENETSENEADEIVTTQINIKEIKNDPVDSQKLSEKDDEKDVKIKFDQFQADETNEISLNVNTQADLATLSKELDIINKRINQASVMTMEHEQFKEKKLINDDGENIFITSIADLDKRICDICNSDIDLEKNLSGLVVGGEFFACESCCKNSSNEELTNWTKSKMKTSSDFQPIGLWVTREKNKKHRW